MQDFDDIEMEGEPSPSGEGSAGRSQRTRLLVIGAVVLLALGYMIYAAFPGNALYFLTVDEFLERSNAQDGRLVRVSGKLVDGTFLREGNSPLTHFQISDEAEGLGNQSLAATYVGVLPDLFFNPHSEIILEGSYGPGQIFETENILVKCPSKYVDIQDEFQASG